MKEREGVDCPIAKIPAGSYYERFIRQNETADHTVMVVSWLLVRCVCRHYCTVNQTQVEQHTAKCSALDHMAMLGSTLDRVASQLDNYTDSELTAKFDTWMKNPESSPDCVFYK